jgi:hypothetical protein
MLARATKPRPPPERTTDSHNHIKVVAVFEWRLDNHHAACRAHGVRVGSTGATNVCQHRRGADCTLFEMPPAILILRVRSHGTRLPKELCTAIRTWRSAIMALAELSPSNERRKGIRAMRVSHASSDLFGIAG